MGDQYTFSGDFRGSILNIKSTLTQVNQRVQTLDSDPSVKLEISKLVSDLEKILEKTPLDKIEDAEVISKQLDALMKEASAEKPNRKMLEITGDGLKKAASNLEVALPTVFMIASQLVGHVIKLAH